MACETVSEGACELPKRLCRAALAGSERRVQVKRWGCCSSARVLTALAGSARRVGARVKSGVVSARVLRHSRAAPMAFALRPRGGKMQRMAKAGASESQSRSSAMAATVRLAARAQPNPSIERTSKRLRLLAAAHVER
jgi:hypothetical protein